MSDPLPQSEEYLEFISKYPPLLAIGNTPMVELFRTSPKAGVRIFAKLEGQNPTGSVMPHARSR